ncbi:LOW QUALITY PROTEIN: hypothetical protein CRUP_031021, partial [Coryphaenoides rupestris]
MDPTSMFFSKLRLLGVTLENEAESLLAAYQTWAEIGDGVLSLRPCWCLPPPPLPSSLAMPLPPTLLLPPKCTLGCTEEEEELKRMGTAWCPEAPPVLSVPPLSSSLATPLPPALLLMPKRTLRMEEEEEELRVPQMKDFGILEHTLCLNNDFTMDLHWLAS